MDNELKTLKDMSAWVIDNGGSRGIPEEDLRQEAIKHIKSLRDYESPIEGIKDHISVILYLKYIFNITEEDIKNE